MAEFSLIKIDGELTKPATLLVEKISSAIGIVFEPTKIKRKARAEAEAQKITAIASIEISALEQRAINRLIGQQARKQKNIEQITAQAEAELPPEAKVKDLDEDWIAHFFEQCENVSDAEMQTVWAKLLSSEATNPGSYSKRTVNFVSTLDKKDAELFTNLCDFVYHFMVPTVLIYDSQNEIYNKNGINFNTLKHLDSLGLISFESLSGYERQKVPKKFTLYYYGRLTEVECPNDSDNAIKIGNVLLTNIGRELLNISGSKPNEEFYEYICNQLSGQGLVLSSLIEPGRSF